MTALDDKLDMQYPLLSVPSASLGSTASNTTAVSCVTAPAPEGSAVPKFVEDEEPELQEGKEQVGYTDSQQSLLNICEKDPYRPEDHVLTAEEMWGGLSSEEDGDAAQCPPPALIGEAVAAGDIPSARRPEHGESSEARQGLRASRTHAPAVSASAVAGASAGEVRVLGPSLNERCGPSSTKTMASCRDPGKLERLATAGCLLQQACHLEPYRPEDHILTAEEMWGSSDDGGEGMQLFEAVQQDCGYQPEDYVLTVEEMWGDPYGDDANGAGEATPMADVASAGAEGSGCTLGPRAPELSGIGNEDSSKRLRWLLAGTEAPRLLGNLGFEELAGVAKDCQCAVETLQWVLARQRDLLVAGAVSGAGPP